MRLGRVLLDPAARGRGLDRELISAAVRTGFESTAPRAVTSGVDAHNIPARRVQKSLGFRETGRVRRTEADGRSWRALEVELPRPS